MKSHKLAIKQFNQASTSLFIYSNLDAYGEFLLHGFGKHFI